MDYGLYPVPYNKGIVWVTRAEGWGEGWAEKVHPTLAKIYPRP